MVVSVEIEYTSIEVSWISLPNVG